MKKLALALLSIFTISLYSVQSAMEQRFLIEEAAGTKVHLHLKQSPQHIKTTVSDYSVDGKTITLTMPSSEEQVRVKTAHGSFVYDLQPLMIMKKKHK